MKRHRFDPFSLVFGALVFGLATSFLLGSTIGAAKRSWWPIFAVLVGCTVAAWAIGVVLRDRTPTDPEAPTESLPDGDDLSAGGPSRSSRSG